MTRNVQTPLIVCRAALAIALFTAACGGGGSTGHVAAVQLQTTNMNPRVGEAVHVGATPVDAHGLTVQGVPCAFASSNAGVAAVDATNGTVTPISPGVATITATCGGQQASVDITVRPNTMTLTITKQGDGGGAVFASPSGSGSLYTYDPGTAVTLTATANPGSAFTGWGGACAGVGPCNLVMNADMSVTATFRLSETFVSNTWNTNLGTVTNFIGCRYAVSASGVLTLQVVENAGSVTGTGSTTAHFNVVVTYTPPGDTCTGNPFDTQANGNITGSDANLSAALASSSGAFTFTFSGTRSGNTINGSAVVHDTLHDGSGNPYPVTGNTGNFALAKQN